MNKIQKEKITKQETPLNYEEEVKKCKTLEDVLGPNGLIKKMLKGVIERMLQEELNSYLGYEKYSAEGKKSGNSRNGNYPKKVRSSVGELGLEIPRDRNGDFNPQVIKKYQTDVSEFDQKIISMYARGMTTRDIQAHVYEIYGTEISPAMVSMITDKVMHLVYEWQNRPLAPIYVVTYFDAIHYKVRENGRVISKASYTCLGIDKDGQKDILGLWIGESEGAKFWLTVFNELKNRGVNDILIACVDGLKGMPEAIQIVFPKAQIQLCIIHMIRNSLKYIASKNKAEFIIDLKLVYQALTEKEAEYGRDQLVQKWLQKYPLAVKPWITHWHNITGYFQYPFELRRLIYTTNAVEALHRQFRKVTKNRAVFTNDDALIKMLFLATRDIQKKWTHQVHHWPSIITQLSIFFAERLMLN